MVVNFRRDVRAKVRAERRPRHQIPSNQASERQHGRSRRRARFDLPAEVPAATARRNHDAREDGDPAVSLILMQHSVSEEGYDQRQHGHGDYSHVDADVAVERRERLSADDAVDDGESGDRGQVEEDDDAGDVETATRISPMVVGRKGRAFR
ncbi:hypothetical protein LOZ53_006822 [Ophidiomyces ophidiicola]|nr:hypothetical protein LOZ54_006663 [Ophidiomyces ophidiicola]KAI1978819.1 hypothetical protein LOZ53_006822 [Ophidiomyces ophidiicola]KAI1979635.1 hypothetical protein LOZ55_001780 [Ophidiomyces ophidiicola]KAI1999533.1 hypothetical protein LOZ51_002024 [Ophidiomyces ophidiicola]